MTGAPVDPETDAIRHVALRWIESVASANVDKLANLMTTDIVVIHGNGRTLEGRDAVLADFAQSFKDFRIEQSIDFEETVVAGTWAFDRATVHTTITQLSGGDRMELQSRTMTILRKQESGDRRVGRAIGVIVQSPQSSSNPDA